MSWSTKVVFFLAPFLISTLASAQRINFNGYDTKATLQTHSLYSNSAIAPVEVQLSIPGIDLNRDDAGFDQISVEGLSPLNSYGNPDVYTAGTLVAVPAGFEPRLSVINQEQRELNGVTVCPAQKKLRCHSSSAVPFHFNRSFYASNGIFPAQNVELQEVGHLQGLRLVRIALHPMQMDMGRKLLRVTTNLTARVSFEQTSAAAPVTLSPTFYQMVRTVTANGNTLGAAIRAASGPETMLIFTGDAYKQSLQPLVQWKKSQGLQVEVFSFTEAGGSNDNVKAFIKKYYDSHAAKPTYLLFVGNKDTMPPFMEDTANGLAASDLRYALVGGNDRVPDLLYGRIVADTEADVQAQMNRWIEYEKTPEQNTWYPQAMTIASGQTGATGVSDVQYAQQTEAALKQGTYQKVDHFYEGEHSATAANITQALSEGRSWLTYIGHGSGTSWASTNDTFDVSSIGNLHNEGRLPVVIDVACENASWVGLDQCFGKAFVTQVSHGKAAGAVGYYGGSVSVSWDPPAIMSVGIARYHFAKPVHSLGGSVFAGQMYLVEQMGTTDDTYDNLKWFNLFGDPSMDIRTAVPAQYQLTPKVDANGTAVVVEISAKNTAGKPMMGITASLNSPAGDNLGSAQTDAQGNAKLISSVKVLPAGTILTTSGYNAETHQVALQ